MAGEKKRSIVLREDIRIRSAAGIGGKREGQGPLRSRFDRIYEDAYLGQDTWEKAEQKLLADCYELSLEKAGISRDALDCIFAGDLLAQCISSAMAAKDSQVPYFGLYGACSTITEALSLAALCLESRQFSTALCYTGSHFCSAERQFRFPLEYGGQRPPSSQWTVTGAGAALLQRGGSGPRISVLTPGRIVDAGINDPNSMGAAMAPAAADSLLRHFEDTGRDPGYYDAVFTGDLGALGHDILQKLMKDEGIELGCNYMDCGVLIYDLNTQDVHAGGSGAGCCASVLCSHILKGMEDGIWNRVLVAATGALMSPLSCQQGASIPGICHAVAIER